MLGTIQLNATLFDPMPTDIPISTVFTENLVLMNKNTHVLLYHACKAKLANTLLDTHL